MDLLDAIKTRRTARAYRDETVAVEIITGILQLAGSAPSACNKRGWKFIHVDKREDLDWLFKRGGSSVLQAAKQALVVCYQRETENSEWDDNIQSAAAIIAYFQLLAHDRGIGSCWICHLPLKREVSAYFSIPPSYTPVAVVSFGYYKEDAGDLGRVENPPGRLLALNRWDFDGGDDENRRLSFMCRKIFRSIYYMIPFRGALRKVAGRYEKKFEDD